jgi:hypothetical protein
LGNSSPLSYYNWPSDFLSELSCSRLISSDRLDFKLYIFDESRFAEELKEINHLGYFSFRFTVDHLAL